LRVLCLIRLLSGRAHLGQPDAASECAKSCPATSFETASGTRRGFQRHVMIQAYASDQKWPLARLWSARAEGTSV